jgi:hypothetical protein
MLLFAPGLNAFAHVADRKGFEWALGFGGHLVPLELEGLLRGQLVRGQLVALLPVQRVATGDGDCSSHNAARWLPGHACLGKWRFRRESMLRLAGRRLSGPTTHMAGAEAGAKPGRPRE